MSFKGESVTLLTPTITYNADKDEVLTYAQTTLGNVLFGKPSTEQMDEAMRLYSAEASYVLGIPKTFTGSLQNCKVTRERDGKTYRILGNPQPLPVELCPTPWNREALAVVFDG